MAFNYVNKKLHCQGIDLRTVAEKHGTPVYVYSESILNRNAEVLKECFVDRGFKVSYAMKANSNPAILQLFKSYGFGADIVSGGELKMAQHVGFKSEDINFAGVGKTIEEIDLALQTDIGYFNVESQFELEQINSRAGRYGKKARVMLRLNPDIDPQTHPHISTGLKENKFGMSPELVAELLQIPQEYPEIEFKGIHCHIGSQILKEQPFHELIEYLVGYTEDLEKHGVELSHIDFGGGFGVNYDDPFEDILDTTPYLNEFAEKAVDKLGKYQLHVQPGRVLVANSAVLLTKVLGTKDNSGHHFTVIDAATTELIRPALYDAYHAVYPYVKSADKWTTDIVGPVCESSDILAKNRKFPTSKTDDLLVIGSAGAYASSMGSTYNLRPLCPEVLITESGDIQLIRRRQSFNDMIALYS